MRTGRMVKVINAADVQAGRRQCLTSHPWWAVPLHGSEVGPSSRSAARSLLTRIRCEPGSRAECQHARRGEDDGLQRPPRWG